MGIARDSRHKRRSTGGKMPIHKKKRKFESGRPAANTKLGVRRVRPIRARGGNFKYRALRLDHGNYVWQSESVARKTRILDVVYNATNNIFTRTKTLFKNGIVQVDATPFKQWYLQHYNVELGKKKGQEEEKTKKSKHVLAKIAANVKKDTELGYKLEDKMLEQFKSGRLYACIASRPGQVGRADGYILEGKELDFYVKKMEKKK